MTRFLLIFSLLSLSSCVYFNTFYNAKKYFDQARVIQEARLASSADTVARVNDAEKALFDKSIEKCSKVLELYPKKKKYIALSTLLLGEVYYWKGEYGSAVRKFNEFMSNYPDHPDFYRAVYLKGLSFYDQKDWGRAEAELTKVVEQASDRELKRRARYLLAEISVMRGSSFGALDQLKALEGGSRVMQSLIQFKMGNLLFKQKEYKEAYGYFMKVEPVRKSADLAEINFPADLHYQSRLMAGTCLAKTGESAKALAHYEAMLKDNALSRFFGEIYNQIAFCHVEAGRPAEAEKIYLKVAADYPKTRPAAAALYRLGLLCEGPLADRGRALRYYRQAQAEFPNCEEAQAAQERMTNLRAINFLAVSPESLLVRDTTLTKADSALIDSIRKLVPSVRLFRIAELYLYNLNAGDSALIYYGRITALDSAADTSASLPKNRMRALYAMAWIEGNVLNRNTLADSLYRLIIARHPGTEFAKAAGKALHAEAELLTREDSVRLRFFQAESLYADSAKSAEAVASFADFIKAYPNDRLVPRALLAQAWLYENRLYDNAAAEKTYLHLNDSFSGTPYSRYARRKLEGKKANLQEIFVEKPGQGPEGTVLSEKVAKKMESLGNKNVAESDDEGAWVTLASLTATSGTMKGKRAEAAVKKEIKDALSALDELYIDMVDEGLKQQGELVVRLSVTGEGEVKKVKAERNTEGLNDKTLLEETENILLGMEFEESPDGTLDLELKIKFANKSTAKSGDEEP